MLQSLGGSNQLIQSVELFLEWNAQKMQLTGYDSNPAWFTSGFLPDPEGVNSNLSDGLVQFQAGAIYQQLQATPQGLHVTTLKFRALVPACQKPTGLRMRRQVNSSSSMIVQIPFTEVPVDLSSKVPISICG